MLTAVIEDLIRRQRPYYLPQGMPIRGLNNQHWLVFRHRDADNLLKNVVTFLGIGKKEAAYKVLRIDPQQAKVYEYIPRKDNDVPSNALLRTANLTILEKFLQPIAPSPMRSCRS